MSLLKKLKSLFVSTPDTPPAEVPTTLATPPTTPVATSIPDSPDPVSPPPLTQPPSPAVPLTPGTTSIPDSPAPVSPLPLAQAPSPALIDPPPLAQTPPPPAGHPELKTFSQVLHTFPALVPLADSLHVLSESPHLTAVQLMPILSGLSGFITQEQNTLSALQAQVTSSAQTTHPMQPFVTLCEQIKSQPLDEIPFTHEHFLEHPHFKLLRLEIDFCDSLSTYSEALNVAPEVLTQIQELGKVSTTILEKINSLVPPIQQFKSTEVSLRDEITSFASLIEKLQAQPDLTPDWNGKKDALTQKREELAARRESYTADESKINQAISVVTQNLPAILPRLQTIATNLLPLMTQYMAQTPVHSDPSLLTGLQNEISQQQEMLSTLSTIHTQISTLTNSLN